MEKWKVENKAKMERFGSERWSGNLNNNQYIFEIYNQDSKEHSNNEFSE